MCNLRYLCLPSSAIAVPTKWFWKNTINSNLSESRKLSYSSNLFPTEREPNASNLPISNTEYDLSDSETIVYATDLKGNITYANPYFVRVSGFAKEELIGTPQNILRHPDMPVEAFADLWHTIQCGQSWTGLVKNLCKNGDF